MSNEIHRLLIQIDELISIAERHCWTKDVEEKRKAEGAIAYARKVKAEVEQSIATKPNTGPAAEVRMRDGEWFGYISTGNVQKHKLELGQKLYISPLPNDTVGKLSNCLEQAQNGLRWYQDMRPEYGSPADTDLHAEIDKVLAVTSVEAQQATDSSTLSQKTAMIEELAKQHFKMTTYCPTELYTFSFALLRANE